MDITITLSEKTEQIVREQASARDMDIEDFTSDFLEKKVSEDFPRPENLDAPHPLLRLAGMFSSGKTDTSTRAKEILRAGIKMPSGFGGGE